MTPNQVIISNRGKTNVTVSEIGVEGRAQDASNLPAQMAPGTGVVFALHDWVKNAIALRALGGNAERFPVECEAKIVTQDRKKYSLGFTWLFDVKDGAIVKTGIIERPVVEINP